MICFSIGAASAGSLTPARLTTALGASVGLAVGGAGGTVGAGAAGWAFVGWGAAVGGTGVAGVQATRAVLATMDSVTNKTNSTENLLFMSISSRANVCHSRPIYRQGSPALG